MSDSGEQLAQELAEVLAVAFPGNLRPPVEGEDPIKAITDQPIGPVPFTLLRHEWSKLSRVTLYIRRPKCPTRAVALLFCSGCGRPGVLSRDCTCTAPLSHRLSSGRLNHTCPGSETRTLAGIQRWLLSRCK